MNSKRQKQLGIITVVFLFMLVFWMMTKLWVQAPIFSFDNWTAWGVPLILLVISAALISLAYSMLDDKLMRMFVALLPGIVFLLLFGVQQIFIGGVAIAFLLQKIGGDRISSEARERYVVNINASMRRGLGLIILSMFLLVSVAYFASPSVQGMANDEELPSFVSEASLKNKVFKYAGTFLDELPFQAREQIENQAISQTLGIMTKLFSQYKKFIPPVFAFALFLGLQSVNFIFVEIASIFGLGIFFMLRATGFVRIEEKDVKAKVLTL